MSLEYTNFVCQKGRFTLIVHLLHTTQSHDGQEAVLRQKLTNYLINLGEMEHFL